MRFGNVLVWVLVATPCFRFTFLFEYLFRHSNCVTLSFDSKIVRFFNNLLVICRSIFRNSTIFHWNRFTHNQITWYERSKWSNKPNNRFICVVRSLWFKPCNIHWIPRNLFFLLSIFGWAVMLSAWVITRTHTSKLIRNFQKHQRMAEVIHWDHFTRW